ncbi:unnamed protein product (macronuclear) [Paramecium tetraurelia]|uniref:Uncharacterized protein n=1 Tax=Paramecium tetraurelia TaxID=5888 RepID=A0BMM8_PARTE|nr:uncharacterized protein GSPATT00030431001 [Paramecium tetraurelia]CAK59795.1 unnamed protein product [Paramecium tetraurelia]|eukprot:XP_001427193.1 hypothetical protein (macronuclear) [Paramecium tetraurelia strain d4-2]
MLSVTRGILNPQRKYQLSHQQHRNNQMDSARDSSRVLDYMQQEGTKIQSSVISTLEFIFQQKLIQIDITYTFRQQALINLLCRKYLGYGSIGNTIRSASWRCQFRNRKHQFLISHLDLGLEKKDHFSFELHHLKEGLQLKEQCHLQPQVMKICKIQYCQFSYCGYHIMAVDKDVELWSWAYGMYGETCQGDFQDNLVQKKDKFNFRINKVLFIQSQIYNKQSRKSALEDIIVCFNPIKKLSMHAGMQNMDNQVLKSQKIKKKSNQLLEYLEKLFSKLLLDFHPQFLDNHSNVHNF